MTPTPTTDIFVKTCLHDRDYHQYCLRSIEKFCTGFRNTVVIEGEHPRGYLQQQVVKLHADQHTDADFILVTDSDTLFNQPVTPESFMVDGKPIWLHTPWTPEMRAVVPWFDPMQRFFGEEPPAEFMRRQPFMFPRIVLQTLREFCLSKHGRHIGDYIMDSKSFSEWNILGYHCWKHHHDLFHWVDTSKDPLPELRVYQAWSHDPLEKNAPIFERILA